ncbi:MFS transporter [Sporosalibacterium faouarense]|uniref:MFS transporter n=1 Tax=Sporosalibacterium faouarense TaxID=516123 RepID=UPI00192AB0ED|nr:MFS transporter [Sporosalibacterium faouarense]
MKKLQDLGKSLFFISFPISFIGFILPIYARDIGASPIDIGILYSSFALFSILARPLVGAWIDKVGRKKGLIGGLFAYVVVMALFMLGDSYKYLLVARVVQSIASSFLWISVYTMVSDVSNNDNNSRNLGHIDQLSSRGEFIGSLIGFTIIFGNYNIENPFKYIFGIYMIFSIVGLLYGLLKVEETLVKDKKMKEVTVIKPRDSRFIKFLLVMGILALVGSMITPIFLIYLSEHITEELSLISFLFIPIAIASTFLPKKFGNISDNFGRKKVLILGMLLQGLFVIFIPIVKNYYVFMLIYTAFSLAGMLRFPAQIALVTEITGNEKRGKNYSLYCLATGLGGIIGPILGSGIYQYIGNDIIFFIQGITYLMASISIVAILRDKKLIN